jgi:hypothetical protein
MTGVTETSPAQEIVAEMHVCIDPQKAGKRAGRGKTERVSRLPGTELRSCSAPNMFYTYAGRSTKVLNRRLTYPKQNH